MLPGLWRGQKPGSLTLPGVPRLILHPLLYLALGALICFALTERRLSAGAWLAVGCSATVLVGFLSASAGLGRWLLEAALWLAPLGLVALMLRRPMRERLRRRLTSRNIPAREAVPIAVLAIAVGWLLWYHSGIPPANYDVLSYHLPLALEFGQADGGRTLLMAPETFYSRLPLGAPILEAPLVPEPMDERFGLGRHALFALALLCGMTTAWRITRRLGGRLVAPLVAAVLFVLHPLLLDGLRMAMVDVLLAAMGLAAVELLLVAAGPARSRPAAFLAGTVAAGIVTMKLSAAGVFLVPAGIAAACWLLLPRRGGTPGSIPRLDREGVVRFAAFALGVAVMLTPWLTRAALVGGHPFHPFAGEVTEAGPGWPWSAEQAEFVTGVHGPRSVLSAEYWKDAFTRTGRFGYTIPGTGISLLLLASVVGAWFLPQRTGLVLLAMPALGYLAWLGVEHNPSRFLFPVFAPLFPLAALGLWHAARAGRVPLLLTGLAALFFVYHAVQPFLMAREFYPQHRSHYRERAMDEYVGPGLMAVVRTAREETRGGVLLFFEARPSLFHEPVVSNTVWDRPPWEDWLRESADAEAFARRLAGEGIGGVFVNEAEWGRLLDFYAAEGVPLRGRLIGRIGINAPLREETIMAALEAYPPHRFAGLTERDLTVLRDFLRWSRRAALQWVPVGDGGAEIWFAPIPESNETP